jgi:hypothetical protein
MAAWLVLHFVYKLFSGSVLEVQFQVRGQPSCGENSRLLGASCAGTELADVPGRLRAMQVLANWPTTEDLETGKAMQRSISPVVIASRRPLFTVTKPALED